MKNYISILLVAALLVLSCTTDKKSKKDAKDKVLLEKKIDSVVLSFTFLGCNRVDRHQEYDTLVTNASTANLYALQRIWNEITDLKRKPDLFFFLGDMVLAESTTQKLNSQLAAWKQLYYDKSFSSISDSDIEMVAIPGNHEMLYWAQYPDQPNHDEWPLKGSTKIWMHYMSDFMPKDREHVQKDSIDNQMTFSFTRKNVGFVLMNTDTYNAPTKENPYGLEGQIPTQWIIDKVAEYKSNPKIDHVFVLGHKPYYVSGQPETGHEGLPEGPVLWPALNKNNVVAMLSAHLHDYQRMQPGGEGTYQVIAGNSGSKGSAKFFGYSKIDILSNGDVKLTSMGYDTGKPYYKPMPNSPSTVRDATTLTWTKNGNPYPNN